MNKKLLFSLVLIGIGMWGCGLAPSHPDDVLESSRQAMTSACSTLQAETKATIKQFQQYKTQNLTQLTKFTSLRATYNSSGLTGKALYLYDSLHNHLVQAYVPLRGTIQQLDSSLAATRQDILHHYAATGQTPGKSTTAFNWCGISVPPLPTSLTTYISSSGATIKTFENPIGAFDNPLVAFDNPLVAFDNPIGAFDNPLVAFDNPIGAFDNPIGAFDNPIGAKTDPTR